MTPPSTDDGSAEPVAISLDVRPPGWPEEAELFALARRVVDATLATLPRRAEPVSGEVSLLFTQDADMQALNRRWRGIDRPTNVLAFPYSGPETAGDGHPLGDVVLAYGTLSEEAARQGKTFADHATHLLVHGFLHLLGYDHDNDRAAEDMEAAEVRILATLGIADPYGDRSGA